ncbi:UNVERIFIED_CONTAM: hypothetical protein Sradi_4397500 [Sesamum radiatum]|uniref:Uncharacterized protein n=1 Tax=Sesamum radiatum TaxID=300843 RepID=A0AAW2NP41_SESRA
MACSDHSVLMLDLEGKQSWDTQRIKREFNFESACSDDIVEVVEEGWLGRAGVTQ